MYTYLGAFGEDSVTPFIERNKVICDVFFALMIGINFITDYIPEMENHPIRNHKMIARNYIDKGEFWPDIICWFPLNRLIGNWGHKMKLFYFIKCYRIN